MSKAIAKQIHDEKQGLATGQPEIEIADSLSNSWNPISDESDQTRLSRPSQRNTGDAAPGLRCQQTARGQMETGTGQTESRDMQITADERMRHHVRMGMVSLE